MTTQMIEQARSKIPDVVAKMVAYERGTDDGLYKETVKECNADGKVLHTDYYTVWEAELLNHIKRAMKMHMDVNVADDKVTIRRELSHGRYYLVEYVPIDPHVWKE